MTEVASRPTTLAFDFGHAAGVSTTSAMNLEDRREQNGGASSQPSPSLSSSAPATATERENESQPLNPTDAPLPDTALAQLSEAATERTDQGQEGVEGSGVELGLAKKQFLSLLRTVPSRDMLQFLTYVEREIGKKRRALEEEQQVLLANAKRTRRTTKPLSDGFLFSADGEDDEDFGGRSKKSKPKAARKRSSSKSRSTDPETLLHSTESMLCDVDLRDIINFPNFSNLLSPEEKDQLLDQLPLADRTSLERVKDLFLSSELRSIFAKYKEMLEGGAFDKRAKDRRRRTEPEVRDAWKEKFFEEYWGQRKEGLQPPGATTTKVSEPEEVETPFSFVEYEKECPLYRMGSSPPNSSNSGSSSTSSTTSTSAPFSSPISWKRKTFKRKDPNRKERRVSLNARRKGKPGQRLPLPSSSSTRSKSDKPPEAKRPKIDSKEDGDRDEEEEGLEPIEDGFDIIDDSDGADEEFDSRKRKKPAGKNTKRKEKENAKAKTKGKEKGKETEKEKSNAKEEKETEKQGKKSQEAPKRKVPTEKRPNSGVSFRNAAYSILKRENKPLNANEITRIGLAEGLFSTSGKTPHNTLAALLYCDIKKNKETLFTKVKAMTFGLKEWEDPAAPAPAT